MMEGVFSKRERIFCEFYIWGEGGLTSPKTCFSLESSSSSLVLFFFQSYAQNVVLTKTKTKLPKLGGGGLLIRTRP